MKTVSRSITPRIRKTRLLLIVATFLLIAVVIQLLADQRFVVSLMLIVVLGVFGWYYNSVSRPLQRKRIALDEGSNATWRSADEALPADNPSYVVNDSQEKDMHPKSGQGLKRSRCFPI